MADKPDIKVSQILLAVDAWGCSQASLHRAITLATYTRSQIQCLYIEDSDLLQIARLPFAREVSFYSAQAMNLNSEILRRNLRKFANELQSLLERQAKMAAIYSTFKTVQGQRIPSILQESQAASIIVLPGYPSWGTHQLQIVHSHPLIAIVLGDTKQDTRLLNIATSMAKKEHGDMLMLYYSESNKKLAESLMSETGMNFQLHAYNNTNEIIDYLQRTKPASLVIADTNPLVSTAGRIQQLSRRLKCDIIISQSH